MNSDLKQTLVETIEKSLHKLKADGKTDNDHIDLAIFVTVIDEVLSHFRIDKMQKVSNWILAGAIAFLYSILLDPKQFSEIYGVNQVKAVAALFVISIVCGVLVATSASLSDALEESKVIKTLFEAKQLLRSSEKLEKIKNDSDPPEKLAAQRMLGDITSAFRGTMPFWIQMAAFGAAVSILFVSFLLG